MALLGCGSTTSQVGGDAAPEAAPSDVSVEEVATLPPPRCAPIAGTSAFGVEVTGAVTLEAGGTVPGPRLFLYFPEGRVAGGEAMLAMHTSTGWSVARSKLDASLGASDLRVADPHCRDAVDATLLGPSDGLVARVTLNVTSDVGSDEVRLRAGAATLCGNGAVPPLSIVTVPRADLLRPLTIDANAPLDPTTVGAVVGSQPVDATDDAWRLRIAPAFGALGLEPTLALELAGVRDVLGRPLPRLELDVPLPSAVLSGSAAGITSAPPGSGATPTVDASGVMTIPFGSKIPWAPADRYAIRLPDPEGASKLWLRHRTDCVDGGPVTLTVVGATGKTATRVVACAATLAEETITLPPSDGRYVLRIDHVIPKSAPCNYPARSTDVRYVLGGFRYEP